MDGKAPHLRQAFSRFGLSAVVILLSLGLGEIVMRCVYTPPPLYTERNTLYRYDPELGWFPIPLLQGTCRNVRVRHNAMGFRDREHPDESKKALVVLGDSFVYGYDVEQNQVFTHLLQERLPEWNVYNLGVSGYGTDQELLLLQKYSARLNPKIVLLLFNGNDWQDNGTNKRYGYFKPFYTFENNHLQLQGVPVPKCLLYYPAAYPRLFKSVLVIRLAELIWRPIARRWPVVRVADPTFPLLLAMRDAVESRHARFLLGFTDMIPVERRFCDEERLACLDLRSSHVTDTGHWDPRGHQNAADKIFHFLFL